MYLKEFNLGYLTWKENIFFGGGINSFYLNCKINYDFCSNHPHNYYLEILTETGIIGFILISLFFSLDLAIFLRARQTFYESLQ